MILLSTHTHTGNTHKVRSSTLPLLVPRTMLNRGRHSPEHNMIPRMSVLNLKHHESNWQSRWMGAVLHLCCEVLDGVMVSLLT